MEWFTGSSQYNSYGLAIQGRREISQLFVLFIGEPIKKIQVLGQICLRHYFKTLMPILSSPTLFTSFKHEDSELFLKK